VGGKRQNDGGEWEQGKEDKSKKGRLPPCVGKKSVVHTLLENPET